MTDETFVKTDNWYVAVFNKCGKIAAKLTSIDDNLVERDRFGILMSPRIPCHSCQHNKNANCVAQVGAKCELGVIVAKEDVPEEFLRKLVEFESTFKLLSKFMNFQNK